MKISMRYFEGMGTEVVQRITGKDLSNDLMYQIIMWLELCSPHAKAYVKAKQKLIEKYARKHDNDGEEMKGGKIVRKWKKGDVVTNGDQIEMADMMGYVESLEELQDRIVEISGIEKIEVDFNLEPKISGEEMRLLFPIVKPVQKN